MTPLSSRASRAVEACGPSRRAHLAWCCVSIADRFEFRFIIIKYCVVRKFRAHIDVYDQALLLEVDVNTLVAPPGLSGGQITVDLDALVANYRWLRDRAAPAAAGAVVKADAYGLGCEAVVGALVGAGCRTFFVAHLSEAFPVISTAPAAQVVILNGIWPGSEPAAVAAGVVPVLNSVDQICAWRDAARAQGRPLKAMIQIDSGMSRLGLSEREVRWLEERPELFETLDVLGFMSHLACADTPDHPANTAQGVALARALARLPRRPVSFANSAAVQALPCAHGDLVRCGLALYGVGGVSGRPNPMRPVIALAGRVIQVRKVGPDVGVGYGHDFLTRTATTIATVAIGYADGLARRLAGRAALYFGEARLPIIGRISMDSLMVDASALPSGSLRPGDLLEVIGAHQSLEDWAAQADTIPYEILTSLGRRLTRCYVGSDGDAQ
ncbi:MAG: alanine racemase [Proteobacteria bacterium]|nr:alanine racemase [Pseudomonadota bacterium]